MLLLCGIVGLAVGALSLSAEIIEPKVPQYLDRLQEIANLVQTWASDRNLPIPKFDAQSSKASSQSTQRAIGSVRSLISVISLTILTISLLVLMLLEVSQYRHKIQKAFSNSTSDRLISAVGNTSEKLRRYLGVMTLTSLLTGVLTIVWCFIVGVDLTFV